MGDKGSRCGGTWQEGEGLESTSACPITTMSIPPSNPHPATVFRTVETGKAPGRTKILVHVSSCTGRAVPPFLRGSPGLSTGSNLYATVTDGPLSAANLPPLSSPNFPIGTSILLSSSRRRPSSHLFLHLRLSLLLTKDFQLWTIEQPSAGPCGHQGLLLWTKALELAAHPPISVKPGRLCPRLLWLRLVPVGE